MQKTTFLSASILTVVLVFSCAFFVAAQDNIAADIAQDTEITAEQLGIAEPSVLPTSPVYFLKDGWRSIHTLFTFNPEKKTALKMRHANERLIEARKMADAGAAPEKVGAALDKYETDLAQAGNLLEQAGDNAARGNLLDKFYADEIKRQKLFEKFGEKKPELAEKIEKIKDASAEKIANVGLNIEGEEQFKERFLDVLERQPGSDFKSFKNIEVLQNVAQKVPKKAQEAILGVIDRATEKFENTVRNMDDAQRERFEQYADRIPGNDFANFNTVYRLHKIAEERGMEPADAVKNIRETFINRFDKSATAFAEGVAAAERTPEELKKKTEELFAEFGALLNSFTEEVQVKQIVLDQYPSASVLYEIAKKHFAEAQEAFDAEDYGKAHGRIVAAIETLKNSIRQAFGGMKEKLPEALRGGVERPRPTEDNEGSSVRGESMPAASVTAGCPVFVPPSPDFCLRGEIVKSGVDRVGCPLPPKCVFGDNSEIRFFKPKPILCPLPPFKPCTEGEFPKKVLGSDGCVKEIVCVAGTTMQSSTGVAPRPVAQCSPVVIPEGCSGELRPVTIIGSDGCKFMKCERADATQPPTAQCPSFVSENCGPNTMPKKIFDEKGCVKEVICVNNAETAPTGIPGETGAASTESGILCTHEYLPVCGADNHTYGNRCMAKAAGVVVAYEGVCKTFINSAAQECPPLPSLINCPAGQDRRKITDDKGCLLKYECGPVNYTGTSSDSATVCPDEYKPVCGMDATTYRNACLAKLKGVAVAFDGVCKWETQGVAPAPLLNY